MRRLVPFTSMNRHSILALVAIVTLVATSCGRLPAEAEGPDTSENNNPFAEDGTPSSVDIAGVVVSSEDTVVAPAEGDEIASPSQVETPSDAGPAAPDTSPEPPVAPDTTLEPVTPPPVQQPDPVVPDNGGSSDDTSGDVHVVQLGETLSTIAEEYGLTTSALQDLNNLTDADVITEGQELRIR